MATVTTLTPIIAPVPSTERQEVIDSVFKYSDTFSLWPDLASREGVRSFGGAGYEIPQLVAGNDSAQVFVEDQAPPAAGYQQTVLATAAYRSLRIFTRLTGHARRAAGLPSWDSAEAPWLRGGRLIEAEKALQDLLSLWEQTFIGTGGKAIYNLVGIVDDASTNYYNLSRTTYARLASYVNAAGAAAITTLRLDASMTALYDATYGGRAELIVCAPTQARKIANLVHTKLTLPARGDMGGGAVWAMPDYNGVPILAVRGMLNNEILFLTGIDRHWGWANNEPAEGGIDILPYGVLSDARITQYVMSGALICKAPRVQGKIEALGTT
jgi:hypothetical protein